MTESLASTPRQHLRILTPARVGLGRTGVSQQIADQLSFQRAHALARDAVHARLEAAALAAKLADISGHEVLRLHSMAVDRATYLQRPDLGRILDQRSESTLEHLRHNSWELILVVADGLSALAVERHAAPLIRELLPRLDSFQIAPLCIVEQG
ncbi:MAG: ethanolamine ammonia-lyase light chain EutC, partial [Terracidiphilus sp.]